MEGPSSDLQERQRRAAQNQSLFREVNETIQTLSAAGHSAFYEFACECADSQCVERIFLTIKEYEHIRRIPTHFLVRPGHVYPELERVVETDGDESRYQVVEKFGEAGELAATLDPRS
jgi:hypothetical protein